MSSNASQSFLSFQFRSLQNFQHRRTAAERQRASLPPTRSHTSYCDPGVQPGVGGVIVRQVLSLVHLIDVRRCVCVPTVPAKESDNIALISVRATVSFVLGAVRFLSETLAAKAAGERPLARVCPHVNVKLRLGLKSTWAKRTCIRLGVEIHRLVASARRLRNLILFRFVGGLVRSLSSRI